MLMDNNDAELSQQEIHSILTAGEPWSRTFQLCVGEEGRSAPEDPGGGVTGCSTLAPDHFTREAGSDHVHTISE